MKTDLYLKLLILSLIVSCSADSTDECAEYIGAECVDGKIVLHFTYPPRDVHVEEITGRILIRDHPPTTYSHGTFTRYEVDGKKVIVDPYAAGDPTLSFCLM